MRNKLRHIEPWQRRTRPIERETVSLRTLHPFDRHQQSRGEDRPSYTLDGVVCVTLGRIGTDGNRVIDWRSA